MGSIDSQDFSLLSSRAAVTPGAYVPQVGDNEDALLAKILARQDGALPSATVSFDRPNNTIAYTAGDVVSSTAGSILELQLARANMVSPGTIIISASLRIAAASVRSGESGYRLHLYSAAPTIIADNAFHSLETADAAQYVGFIDLPAPTDAGNALWSQADGILRQVPLDATGKIYGILQTLGAYTPAANTTHRVTLSAYTP